MRLILLALIVIVAATNTLAAGPTVPMHSRSLNVKCTPTINVWVEADTESIHSRETVGIEKKKRVQFNLVGSMAYRGDSVLCNYATRRRDVTTSYSIRCLQPRKERGHKHSYTCQ